LLPGAFAVVPGEIFQPPRTWAAKAYPNLTYFNKVDRGGHVATWEKLERLPGRCPQRFRASIAGRL
jgi:hypothetical protein